MKIAAAITIAAAGFGGGIAYKKFRAYLRDRNEERDARRKKPASTPEEQKATAAASKLSVAKSQKQPRGRKKAATKSNPKTAKAATT